MIKKFAAFIIALVLLTGCKSSSDNKSAQEARAAFDNGEYNIALQKYNEAIDADPKNAQNYLDAAKILAAKSNWAEVAVLLEKGKQNVDSQEIKDTLVVAYVETKEFEKARSLCDDSKNKSDCAVTIAVRSDEGISDAIKNSSGRHVAKFALDAVTDHKKALSELKKSDANADLVKDIDKALDGDLTREDQKLYALANVTTILIEANQLEEAFVLSSGMIGSNLRYDSPYIYRGIVFSRWGDEASALKDFESAYLLSPQAFSAGSFYLLALAGSEDQNLYNTFLDKIILTIDDTDEDAVAYVAQKLLQLGKAADSLKVNAKFTTRTPKLDLLAMEAQIFADQEVTYKLPADEPEQADDQIRYRSIKAFIGEGNFDEAKNVDKSNYLPHLFEYKKSGAEDAKSRAIELDFIGDKRL